MKIIVSDFAVLASKQEVSQSINIFEVCPIHICLVLTLVFSFPFPPVWSKFSLSGKQVRCVYFRGMCHPYLLVVQLFMFLVLVTRALP